MEGTFKKIASVATVLTVGLLAATGVGPRTIAQASRAFANAEPTKDAAYALAEFLGRFTPSQTDQDEFETTDINNLRLASTSGTTPTETDQPAPDLVHPPTILTQGDLKAEFAEATEDFESFLITTPDPDTSDPHFIFENRTIVAAPDFDFSQPTFQTADRAHYRYLRATTVDKVCDIPCTILRLIGITSRSRISRFPITLDPMNFDQDALRVISCNKPAS